MIYVEYFFVVVAVAVDFIFIFFAHNSNNQNPKQFTSQKSVGKCVNNNNWKHFVHLITIAKAFIWWRDEKS